MICEWNVRFFTVYDNYEPGHLFVEGTKWKNETPIRKKREYHFYKTSAEKSMKLLTWDEESSLGCLIVFFCVYNLKT